MFHDIPSSIHIPCTTAQDWHVWFRIKRICLDNEWKLPTPDSLRDKYVYGSWHCHAHWPEGFLCGYFQVIIHSKANLRHCLFSFRRGALYHNHLSASSIAWWFAIQNSIIVINNATNVIPILFSHFNYGNKLKYPKLLNFSSKSFCSCFFCSCFFS